MLRRISRHHFSCISNLTLTEALKGTVNGIFTYFSMLVHFALFATFLSCQHKVCSLGNFKCFSLC